MNITTLAAKNILRNKFRTTLTILGVAVAIVAFVMIRTVLSAWNAATEHAAKDRIGTRHKVSFILPLPRRYVDTVRQTRGVTATTWANWFGGKDPKDPNNFFATMAVDPASFLEVYDEMVVSPAERAGWLEDRRGAIIGDVLAQKLGVKVGDKVTLVGTIYPGNWDFNVSGIYKATRKSVDRSQFIFHWNYLNESVPERQRDKVGWIISRVDQPERAGAISAAIDRVFDVQDEQTISMSERAMNLSFMAMYSALLSALDIISIIVLLILLLILGNTVAMGVRERTNEYGVLRALGFLPRHIRTFILAEGVFLGAIAGAVGLGIAYPFVNFGLGRWLEENMGAWFPYFRVDLTTAFVAFGLALVLGGASALIPAFRAARLSVVDALRKID